MVQTATNPDTNERVALIGGQWQPVLKSATNGSGVKAYLIGDKWITDDGATPSQPAEPPAPEQPKLNTGFSENFTGAIAEPIMKMASGMIAKPAGDVVGLARLGINAITGNNDVSPIALQRQVQEGLTYEPRTVVGASRFNPINAFNDAAGALLSAPGNALAERVRGVSPSPLRDAVANALREAVPQAIGIGAVKATPTIVKKVGDYQIAKAIEKGAAEQDFLVRQAGIMKTAKEGVDLGLSADPAAMNPTVSNRIQSTMTGPESIVKVASGRNTKVLPSIAKRQMGIDPSVSLAGSEGKAAISKALAAHDAPYAQVAALPEIVVSPEALQSIQALKQTPILGAKADAIAANSVIDDAIAGLKPQRDSLTNSIKYQRSPAQILTDIQQLREKAQKTFESAAPTTAQTATAKTQWALAKRLEGLIDDTVGATNPNLLQSLRDARVAKAQIHAWRDAITPEGKINTQSLVKRLTNDDLLTGEIKTVAEFASAFPKAMGLKSAEAQTIALDHAKRWGLGGVVGYGVGHLVGQPVLGGLLGAAAGEGAGALNAMRLTGTGVQNANALAMASRLSNRMSPVTPNATPNGLVPYDYSQPMPNWVPGDPNYRPPAPLGGLLEGPSTERTLRGVKQQREFDYKMEKALDIMRAQSRETLPQRQGTGVQFDLDPVTGKLVPPKVDPVRIIGSEPEFANWKSSMSDVVQVVPEMNSLSGSQIAAKMMDRQWIQDTIKKLQDKERAFADIRAREPALARARARARKPLVEGESGPAPLRGEPPSSETMARTLDFLQEQLSKTPTDVSRKMPGKKTLNHLRQSETNNQLRKLADRP